MAKKRKILALDLDGELTTLAYAELEKEKIKLLGIKTIFLLDIEEAEQEKELIEKLSRSLKELSPAGREVLVCLHSGSLYVGRYALPDLPPKEIPKALRWQFKEAISESEENIIFDYLFVKETVDAEGLKQKHYLVCLVSKKEIDYICRIIEKINLEPRRITIPSFPLFKLLPADIDLQKTYAILDFSWTVCAFSFYQNKQILFSRIIPIGVKNLINALCISIVYKGNKLSLNPEKAWQVLKEVGIPEEVSEAEWQGFPLSQILVLMRPELERLSTELIRSLDYFSLTLKEKNPEKIFLTGIGTSIKGLPKYLMHNIHYPLAELLSPVESGSELSPQERNTVSCSLGNLLSLPDKTINLLPLGYRIERMPVIQKTIRISSLIISLSMLGSIILTLPKSIIQRKELALFKKHTPYFEKLKELNRELRRREEIKSIISQGKINFSWIIQEISAVIPPKAIISQLNLNKSTRTIELLGIIFSGEFVENIVAEIMKNINNSKILFEPKLESIKKAPERGIAEFKMKVKVR
ncbi:MAG: pilus assembly protein PilM [Candidatus Omnitrophica bacterium]|nr:pilus assembly protein PilM [Candidatus Omnitrophota bacterium]MCM8793564.1 pilus assembly protein PilM [Candidatus Omnitrophota bacterium]